jgi:hypothetical protein
MAQTFKFFQVQKSHSHALAHARHLYATCSAPLCHMLGTSMPHARHLYATCSTPLCHMLGTSVSATIPSPLIFMNRRLSKRNTKNVIKTSLIQR